jgi:hypothetical protein
MKMKACCRLIEYKKRFMGIIALYQEGCQLNTLRLAARQRV